MHFLSSMIKLFKKNWSLLPNSLAARTALVLITGIGLIEVCGLLINTLDRLDFNRLTQEQEAVNRATAIYRDISEVDSKDRLDEISDLDPMHGFNIFFSPTADLHGITPSSPRLEQTVSHLLTTILFPPELRPLKIIAASNPSSHKSAIAFQLPDDKQWLNITYSLSPPNPFKSTTLPITFFIMATATGILTIWGVKKLIAPVGTLAAAAERLGQDVNTPPLSENGAQEVAQAARAFNNMAHRINRFVNDRTQLLLAIGHDLRTPITRLKLRSEFIPDLQLQKKFLSDLDELEQMTNAVLAFGRNNTRYEAMVSLDLGALLQTLVDELQETHPEKQDKIILHEPLPHIIIKGRSINLKRAIQNLMDNAINYGGNVEVTMTCTLPAFCQEIHKDNSVYILIEDHGDGIDIKDLDYVFEPFIRIESSRNRSTGGTGLGLSIARNIIRGQGGNITLHNRNPHGLTAIITLIR